MNAFALNEDNYCRLARAPMERHGVDYRQAMTLLSTLTLNVVCGVEVGESPAHQAALLTAVNTGKRAFLGGVSVELPSRMPCRVPWPGRATLDEVVQRLGATLAKGEHSARSHTLYIGAHSHPVDDGLFVVCSGWNGGVFPTEMSALTSSYSTLPIAGVLAGALGVARGFLRLAGLSAQPGDPVGLSLWRPDLNWLDGRAIGPEPEYLPRHLWLLGLGHLGQGYIWNVGMLPFDEPEDTVLVLQDFDSVVVANQSAGLLCESENVGRLKTRVASEWLEHRGFATRLVERRFDGEMRLQQDELFAALCGFDNAAGRLQLESAGFRFIVDCGLGDSAANFDRIDLYTLPNGTKSVQDLWGGSQTVYRTPTNPKLLASFKNADADGPCGVLAETLAGKALSSSFVGAYAGALALGEILRALHGGNQCECARYHLRSRSNPLVIMSPNTQQDLLGECGVIGYRK